MSPPRSATLLVAGLLASTGANAQVEEPEMRFQAEIHGPTAIRFTLIGVDRPSGTAAYRLTDGRDREIPIAEVLPSTGTESLAVPELALDPMRVHYLELPALGLRALVRRDPIFRNIYSSKQLGAAVSDDGAQTTFRIFSPRAHAVRLHLYRHKDDAPGDVLRVVELAKDDDGVWEATEKGNLHGMWYDFAVFGPTDPGNWFYGTHPVHVSDPYALVNDDAMGRSRVWRDGPPPPPVTGGRPRMEDVVAYEVHVQDFTDLLPVGDTETGSLPAMARAGLV
ncbi:MAG: pullulanase, partial [Gemmatimonadales bacterium]|nr:pullulanase [Gemmatimonadales bacterium]